MVEAEVEVEVELVATNIGRLCVKEMQAEEVAEEMRALVQVVVVVVVWGDAPFRVWGTDGRSTIPADQVLEDQPERAVITLALQRVALALAIKFTTGNMRVSLVAKVEMVQPLEAQYLS